MIETYIKFIKAHETILGLVLAAAVIWGVSGEVENIMYHHDNAAESQAQIVATAQAQKDAAVAAQVAADKAALDALTTKLTAANDALAKANSALEAALAKQQQQDNQMTPSELTDRWNVLVPTANAAVTPNGVTLPAAGAHATVDQLEQIPVLTQELSNSKQSEQNTDTLLGASQKQVTDLNSEVSGLNLQLVDNQKVCTAQIAVVKADAAKAKRRWFLTGLVLGFLGRSAIK